LPAAESWKNLFEVPTSRFFRRLPALHEHLDATLDQLFHGYIGLNPLALLKTAGAERCGFRSIGVRAKSWSVSSGRVQD
jgi:hypothetical protein